MSLEIHRQVLELAVFTQEAGGGRRPQARAFFLMMILSAVSKGQQAAAFGSYRSEQIRYFDYIILYPKKQPPYVISPRLVSICRPR